MGYYITLFNLRTQEIAESGKANKTLENARDLADGLLNNELDSWKGDDVRLEVYDKPYSAGEEKGAELADVSFFTA